MVQADPVFDPFPADPRYQEIFRNMGLPESQGLSPELP